MSAICPVRADDVRQLATGNLETANARHGAPRTRPHDAHRAP